MLRALWGIPLCGLLVALTVHCGREAERPRPPTPVASSSPLPQSNGLGGARLELQLAHAAVGDAHLSADRRLVVTASSGHTACIWEVKTGKQLRVLRGHRSSLRLVRFTSADTLHTVDVRGAVIEWDLKTGQAAKQWPAIPELTYRELRHVALPPDARLVVMADDHGEIWVRDLHSGGLTHTAMHMEEGTDGKLRRGWIQALSVSDDGKLAASVARTSGSDDPTLHFKVWRPATFEVVKSWESLLGKRGAFALSGDGEHLVWSIDAGPVTLMEVRRWTDVAELTPPLQPARLRFLGGAVVVVQDDDGGAASWNLYTKASKVVLRPRSKTQLFHIDDELRIALRAGRPRDDGGRSLSVVDLEKGEPVATFAPTSRWLEHVSFAPAARGIASELTDGSLTLWDLGRVTVLPRLDDARGLRRAELSPAGDHAFLFGEGGWSLWDLTRRRRASVLGREVSPIGFLPAASQALLFGPERCDDLGEIDPEAGLLCTRPLDVVHVKTGKRARRVAEGLLLDGHHALSADGKRLLFDIEEEGELAFIDVSTGTRLGSPEVGPEDDDDEGGEAGDVVVRALALSHDGKLALAGGQRPWTSVELFEPESGKHLHELKGHRRGVTAVAFSADAGLAVSGSDDATVRVWDVATGESLHVLEDHTDTVIAVAFSPDAKLVYSAARDATIKLWNLVTKDVLTLTTDGTDWLLLTRDGFFHSNRPDPPFLAVVEGARARPGPPPATAWRPDIILARFGLGSPAIIRHHEDLVRQRLKQPAPKPPPP